MSEFVVRRERPSDFDRIDEIQRSAFERPEEARLVRALRESARPWLSLVATPVLETGGEAGDRSDASSDAPVGHVCFSPVEIVDPGPSLPAAGLAPLAVDPIQQAQGAGGALVRAGLRACLEAGWRAVFLLGDPAYYARFGFELCAPAGLRYESEVFDVAFQSIELVPGALAGHQGWVRYHAAFADV